MRADEYARAANDLSAFLDAFNELLEELEPVESGPLSSYRTWRPRRGREGEADVLHAKVATLAGPAALAFQSVGVYIDYKPPGTWQRETVNPAVVWSTMFDRLPMVEPSLVNQTGLQAHGLLVHMHEVQAERQRGFTGAVAWFLTLGPRIREAAGLPPHSAPGFAVTSLVVLVQGILVAAIGGVLVYPLADWLGWKP